jgi:peroxiredoxin Q/BCP
MPILSWLQEKPLPVGTPAPDFTLRDQTGNLVHLAAYRGRSNVILIFYPGDDTSVCTRQLCELRDAWDAVRAADGVVFGINPQNAESHRKFVEKQKYPFSLLVDQGKQIAKRYNAGGFIVRRSVYAIDKQGVIRFAERGTPAPATVLESLIRR